MDVKESEPMEKWDDVRGDDLTTGNEQLDGHLSTDKCPGNSEDKAVRLSEAGGSVESETHDRISDDLDGGLYQHAKVKDCIDEGQISLNANEEEKENQSQSDSKIINHNGSSSKAGKDQSGVRLSTQVSGQGRVGSKPGVILLGRGNSFSLGRSEVILLHHRHKQSKAEHGKSNRSHSTVEEKLVFNCDSRGSNNHDDRLSLLQPIQEGQDGTSVVKLRWSQEDDGVPSPSPPPISNGMCHLDSRNGESNESSDYFVDLIPCYEKDLKDLWEKTESLMTGKTDKVRKILEEFGIGEPGGGGGEDDDWEWEDVDNRKKEEEEVWQIVQDSLPETKVVRDLSFV